MPTYVPLPDMTHECKECGQTFKTTYAGKSGRRRTTFCGKSCAKRFGRREHKRAQGRNHRARARAYGCHYESVRLADIYERDEWTCQLCGGSIDRGAEAPDPMSPSIDHKVPLAKGGPHTADNLQAAHFICNSLKSDREGVTVG